MKKQVLLGLLLVFQSAAALAEEYPAQVTWSDYRELGLPLSGVIKTVNAKPGRLVSKGESLLTLDCGLYQSAYQQAEALLKGLSPAVERSLKDKELAQELFDRTVLSEVELRNAELAYIETESKYKAVKADLDNKKWSVEYCQLQADSDLIALDVMARVGQVIELKTTKPVLLTVASSRQMSVRSKISRSARHHFALNKAITVRINDKEYPAIVSELHYKSDSEFNVVALVEHFDVQLLPQHNATIIVP